MPRTDEALHHEVIVVGAGFGGVYAVHRLLQDGRDVLCLEAAGDAGGVWYHNRYPGARCDILSIDYSYSFSKELQDEWDWSERYAPQEEILRYIQHVVDRFGLRRRMVFETRVIGMNRDDDTGLWTLRTNTGRIYTAHFVVLAIGPLSQPRDPDFPGFADFRGEVHRTARWPHREVSFEGKRVGVIGTGSSGVQSIPEIAKTAAHLTVFQRTPVFAVPAHNARLSPEDLAAVRARYSEYRKELKSGFAGNYMTTTGKKAAEFSPSEQRRVLDALWQEGGLGIASIFTDILTDESANRIVADYVRERIREQIKDPVLAEKLLPRTYPIATKRPCVESGYYAAFNRPTVSLVDLRETPIERVTAGGIRTSEKHHDLDVIVLATGFDALTGAFTAIDPVNGQGVHLADEWAEGPRTYLGIAVAGFPNLFMVAGPGGTSVLGNVVAVAEAGVDWIADCISWLYAHGHDTIEATSQAQAAWTDHVAEVGGYTLFPKADSWYMGANVPGKKRVLLAYIGGFSNYVGKCSAVAARDYEGFAACSTRTRETGIAPIRGMPLNRS
jgi:cation diffusion facilitator CzcD-associated flavoprotein CzcO